MEYTKLYIGSDNTTGILELDKIRLILDSKLKAYTIIEALGVWNYAKENTAIVEIYGDFDISLVDTLKSELKQDSIMVVKDYKQVNFI
jgi:hypothetical protein